MLLKIYLRNEYEINGSPRSISSKLRKCSTIASLKIAMHPYLLPTPDTMQHSVKYDFLNEHDRPIRATDDYVVPVNDNCRCHDEGLGWSISGSDRNRPARPVRPNGPWAGPISSGPSMRPMGRPPIPDVV
jgi:hypothetical protein